jgi:hypothetical protein
MVTKLHAYTQGYCEEVLNAFAYAHATYDDQLSVEDLEYKYIH